MKPQNLSVLTSRRSRRGITSDQLLIGLVVIAGVVALGAVAIAPVRASFQDERHATNIRAVAQALEKGYVGRVFPTTGAISLARYTADGSIPASMMISAASTSVHNGIGGGISAVGLGPDTFALDTTGLSSAQCIRALTYAWPESVTQVGVSPSTTVRANINDTNANTQCSAATAPITVRLRFDR